jgi:hypothetical protein
VIRPSAGGIAILGILAAAGPGCSSSPTGPNYNPVIPTDLSSTVTNPFFPLVPGSIYQYSGQTPDGLETSTFQVMAAPRVVNGVIAAEVHDVVYLDGALIEDTYDWYAQDGTGNVWYLGEDTKEIDNGHVISREGTWQWGVKKALPGIIMPANPAGQVDVAYRQEFKKGVAEDWGKVISLNQTVTVSYGTFNGCVVTEDWSDLEPTIPHESKTYCPQVGIVLEVVLDGSERIELVGVAP